MQVEVKKMNTNILNWNFFSLGFFRDAPTNMNFAVENLWGKKPGTTQDIRKTKPSTIQAKKFIKQMDGYEITNYFSGRPINYSMNCILFEDN